MSLRKLFKRLVIIVFIMLVLGGMVIGYGWIYWQEWMHKPLPIPKDGITIHLEKGQTLSHVLNELSQQKMLAYPKPLRWYAQLQQQTNVHQGEYFLPQGITPAALLEKLNKGEIRLYQIRFVEGWTIKQVLAALAAQDKITPDTKNLSVDEIAKKLGIENGQLEGWIFPDTYSFSRNSSDLDVLQQAHKKMRGLLDEKWKSRAENLPYKTAYEALIMASIIEKETGHASERDQIAGVFVRRLQQGIKLQTDPTVIYGMGDAYKGRIRRKDLNTPTAYNTYTIFGLPPTPIAIPSLASIDAALHPAAGNALYFVAKGDGTSEFSATLQEHNAAVRRFQLKRRSDYRSAP
ncbi:MAG: endolytic transglycosylase MltG [Cellvibrio sp.]|nr:endolytic transglycosylase MltG [Cellvibrio sp.]